MSRLYTCFGSCWSHITTTSLPPPRLYAIAIERKQKDNLALEPGFDFTETLVQSRGVFGSDDDS